MKGLKCKHKTFRQKTLFLWLLAVSVFFCGFSLASSSASAVSATSVDQYAITPSTSGFGHVTDYVNYQWNNDYPLTQSANDYWVNLPFAGLANVNLMSLRLNKSIPANSLVSLKIVYTIQSVGTNSYVIYNGLQFEHDRVYLYDSCINAYGQPQPISGKYVTLTCNYIFYNATETAIIDSTYGSHIFETSVQTDVADHINVVISQPSSITLSNNGLSESDRQWLSANMPGASSADIQSATESAIEQQREQERQEFDQESSDYQSDLEDNQDQQAIESKMTSIMGVINNFVVAIMNPVVSTCILPIDLRNYTGASFYEVDLCHLSPPSGITNVLNVIFIFFVLGLAYSAINSVVQMYKEVIDG